MSATAEVIKSRVSANSYDIERSLTTAQVTALVDLATHAPSAFKLQNWKFLAVHSTEAKARLLPLAFGQQKVMDAAVTFIVCGTLNPHVTLPYALKPTLDAGIIDQSVYDMWVGAAQGMYQENAQLQRDEAIRSGSLAAMTLMLAAKGQRLVSTPMIGFDQVAVAKEFGLSDEEVPVMLITVGYPGVANSPQKPRKEVSNVLQFV